MAKANNSGVWGGERPPWTGEAWDRDDGLLLNLPVFDGCGPDFKRLILRAVRVMEYEVAGSETWYERDTDKICRLESMPEDELPPLRKDFIGEEFDPGQNICCGGDYDQRLVVVLKGKVLKLIGDAPSGGRCVVRTLTRGDCEGLTEFLEIGSQQRTCALKAGPDGARVRFVPREAVQKLLAQNAPPPPPPEIDSEDENQQPEPVDEDLPPAKRFPEEVEYFHHLLLDRIDALPHEASRQMLSWAPAGDIPLEYMKLRGQDLFMIDDSLGLKASGPLPEGIEERYFLDGQTVLKPGVKGDSLILILRGEVEAEVPEGCGGTCLPAIDMLEKYKQRTKITKLGSWIGDGRREDEVPTIKPQTPEPTESSHYETSSQGEPAPPPMERVWISTLIKPDRIRDAKRRIKKAADENKLPVQEIGDWNWAYDDPDALVALDLFEKWRMLSTVGEQKAEAVRLYQNPPEPDPPPSPRAILGSGAMVGQMALLGCDVHLAGVVRAKGPVLITVLHRHVLLEAIAECEEYGLFKPDGVRMKETIRILQTPPARPELVENTARPAHLGPATGPPAYSAALSGPAAGTASAWGIPDGPYGGRAGADAMHLLLLNAIRQSTLLWSLLDDAPPRLLEAFIKLFEPRWLLPNEIVVEDEEPDSNFMFVVIHGTFIIMLEGAEIDRISQGAIQGEAQLLGLNDWTRTVLADPKHQGETLIQILRRDRLLQVLAGHPVPKMKMRQVEHDLRAAKAADWRILQSIPTFRSIDYKPFLARLFKDADILMYSPGDHIAVCGQPGSSLIIILAGVCRSQQPQTLFCVDLERGHWCFQNNYLGNEKLRDHDLVVLQPTMVLTLHRHTLLNAVVAHPIARGGILENETWRGAGPQLQNIHIFEGVPPPVLSRLVEEASPRYFRQDSAVIAKGESIEDDALLLILRGEVQVSILGIHIRKLGPGDTIGLLRYLDLPMVPSPCEFSAIDAVDAVCIPRGPMFVALEDERYDDDVQKFKQAMKVFGGGEVLDKFGYPIGGGGVFAVDCVERSEIFSACSEEFKTQIPQLVEDLAYFPGEKIFRQGDPGTFMYFIQAGRVKMKIVGLKKEEFVDAGSTIGEMAVLGQTAGYPQTAIAETHVWVRALHKKLLDRALASFPGDERRLQGKASSSGPGLFD